jgi:hypothetical protein
MKNIFLRGKKERKGDALVVIAREKYVNGGEFKGLSVDESKRFALVVWVGMHEE